MKKFALVAVTLALISSASLADQNLENMNKMDEMRHQFMVMTDQMIDGQMHALKMNEDMLGNYQRLLKLMMENESNKK